MIKNYNREDFLKKIEESKREENIFYGEVASPFSFIDLIYEYYLLFDKVLFIR